MNHNYQKLLLIILSLFLVSGAINARTSMTLFGSLETEIMHTPERQLEAWQRLQLHHQLELSGDVVLYMNLGGWTPKYYTKPPLLTAQPRATFKVNRLYMKVKGALLPGKAPLDIGFGDLGIAYSPYSVWINRWEETDILTEQEWANPLYNYNMVRRGVTVENMSLFNYDLAAFFIWDGLGSGATIYPYRTAFGGKADGKKLSFIYSRYTDARESPESTEDEVVLYPFNIEEDHVFEVGLKEQKVGSFVFSGTYANHIFRNILLGESKADLALLNLSWPIASEAELIGKYYSYEEGFNPRYRDKTPKFDPHTGQKLAWNEIDRFRGQQGYAVGLHTLVKDLDLTLLTRGYTKGETGQFQEVSAEGIVRRNRLDLVGRLALTKNTSEPNFLGSIISELAYDTFLQGTLLLKSFASLDLHATGYLKQIKDEYTFAEQKYGLKAELTAGKLDGLILEVGRRNLNGIMQSSAALEYQLPIGLIFSANYATPNFVESGDFDQNGELLKKDNCLKIFSKLEF